MRPGILWNPAGITSVFGKSQGGRRIVCWGDSITFGAYQYLDPTIRPYPTWLQRMRPDDSISNEGVSGQNSAQIMARVQAGAAKYRGAIHVFMSGHNDPSVAAIPLWQSISSIREMVTAVWPDPFLVLSCLTACGAAAGNAEYDGHMAINTALAALYGANFLDVRAVLRDSSNEGQGDTIPPSLVTLEPNATKWLHLTSDGYYLLAATVSKRLDSVTMRDNSIFVVSDSFVGDGALNGRATDGQAPLAGGGVGGTWAATPQWATSGGRSLATPGTGTEIVSNGNMETGSPPTGWLAYNSTLTADADCNSGAQALKITTAAGQANGRAYQAITPTAHRFYRLTFYCKLGTSTAVGAIVAQDHHGNNSVLNVSVVPGTTWRQYTATFVAKSTTQTVSFRSLGDGLTVLVDDVSIVPLTTADLLSAITTAKSDVVAAATCAQMSSGVYSWWGVALNIDDPANPQNFVLVVHGGYSVYFYKFVAGVATLLQTTAVAAGFAAGDELKIVKSDTTYTVFLNKTKMGVSQTVADAGIVSNTKHGAFSSNPNNLIDSWRCV